MKHRDPADFDMTTSEKVIVAVASLLIFAGAFALTWYVGWRIVRAFNE